MLPKELKPRCQYDLIRLGQNNDGGYLVEKNSVLSSKGLISFGLNLDWSFEKDFSSLNKQPIHCYDHTVKYSNIKKYSRNSLLNIFNKKFWSKKGIRRIIESLNLSNNYKNFFSGNIIHFRQAIGLGNNLIKLDEVLKRMNVSPIFLKIDIEGSEYRILDDIIRLQNNICGLVIEFHDVDLNLNKILDFINKLSLNLVHIHGQNPGGESYLDSNGDPTQIELSFSNTTNFINQTVKIPHHLDQPSDARFNEVNLIFKD
jgi:FkbM family methyltransferase